MVRLAELREKFEAELLAQCAGMTINGAGAARLPGSTNITIAGVDAEALIVNMPEVIIGTGSACTSGAPEPSYVLLAMRLSGREAYETVRMGLGRLHFPNEQYGLGDLVSDFGNAIRTLQS
jgi:cysteine desulfurase